MKNTPFFPVQLFLLPAFLFIVVACAETQEEVDVPSGENNAWTFTDPAAAGLPADSLAAITTDIEAGVYPNTHALLIEYDGALVYERYFTGTDNRWGEDLGERAMGPDSLHDLRSVSKSITSLLLGIALKNDFEEKVSRPLASYFPDLEVEASKQAITLHHALTMTAGLAWNEMDVPYTEAHNDELRLYDATDPVAYVFDRPLVSEPGAEWYYSGGLSQVLASLIYELTGQPVDEYARVQLFEPLGITDFEWLGPGGWEPDNPAAMSGLRLTARDLAKIGSLFLHDGQWNGRQVVPAKWIELSGTRYVQETSKWSEDGRWGYGYQWWVGTLPGGPTVIAGVGNGNQRLFIVPEADLAVTIFAGEYDKFEGHSNRLMYRLFAARE